MRRKLPFAPPFLGAEKLAGEAMCVNKINCPRLLPSEIVALRLMIYCCLLSLFLTYTGWIYPRPQSTPPGGCSNSTTIVQLLILKLSKKRQPTNPRPGSAECEQ